MSASGVTARGGGPGGQGGRVPPDTFHWEISTDLPGKREASKKGKMEKKRRKIKKGRWKIKNGMRKRKKMKRGLSFFLFSFILFIYLFIFAFHFSKPLKFESSSGKKHFALRKKSIKIDLPPSEKYSCYAPDVSYNLVHIRFFPPLSHHTRKRHIYAVSGIGQRQP